MSFGRAFFRFAAVAAFASALTTLAVHLLPRLWRADSFEQGLALPSNPLYMGRLWIVLVHCALVVISMFAVAVRKLRSDPALASFGLLGYLAFALAEWLRTSLVLFAVNRSWRVRYAGATDETARGVARGAIEAFGGVNDALFFLFFTAFTLGTLCYGLALSKGRGLEKAVGLVYLIWFALNLPPALDEFAGFSGLATPFAWVGPVFQPAARVLTGVWLWRCAPAPTNFLDNSAR